MWSNGAFINIIHSHTVTQWYLCLIVFRMMESVRSVLFLSLLLAMVEGIKINQVPGDPMVWEGSTLDLGVVTDSAWFLCVWTSPSGDKQCAIQESGVSSVCAGDPRIVITGDTQTCRITVTNVTREDWGTWMCLVQEGEDFQTHRKYVNVEVATEAVVTLSWNDDNNNNSQEGLSGRILEVMEDTETTIQCNARKAYPRPTFLWSPPESLTLGSEKTIGSYNNQTHEYSGYSAVVYNAKLNETNSTIICRVLQAENYVETISVVIKVNPKPLPLILVRLGPPLSVRVTTLSLHCRTPGRTARASLPASSSPSSSSS